MSDRTKIAPQIAGWVDQLVHEQPYVVEASWRTTDRIKAEALREAAAALPPDVCRWAILELRARADELDPPAKGDER